MATGLTSPALALEPSYVDHVMTSLGGTRGSPTDDELCKSLYNPRRGLGHIPHAWLEGDSAVLFQIKYDENGDTVCVLPDYFAESSVAKLIADVTDHRKAWHISTYRFKVVDPILYSKPKTQEVLDKYAHFWRELKYEAFSFRFVGIKTAELRPMIRELLDDEHAVAVSQLPEHVKFWRECSTGFPTGIDGIIFANDGVVAVLPNVAAPTLEIPNDQTRYLVCNIGTEYGTRLSTAQTVCAQRHGSIERVYDTITIPEVSWEAWKTCSKNYPNI